MLSLYIFRMEHSLTILLLYLTVLFLTYLLQQYSLYIITFIF